MNGPIGCDTLPLAAGALPELLPSNPNSSASDTTLSFEDVLGEETAEEPVEEPVETAENVQLLSFFPLTPPPLILLAESIQGTSISSEGIALIEGGEHKLPTAVPPAPAHPEQIAETPAITPPKGHGIPAAQQPSMVFTHSMDEEAASAPEALSLPVEYIDSPVFEQQVSTERPIAQSTSEPLSEAEFVPVEALIAPPSAASQGSEVSEIFQTDDVQPVATRTVEEIESHIQILKSSGNERLEVVVRPDGDTQLHLRITRAEGLIQVQARCDRGDFAALDAHWTNVQSSLAAQGIRVEPLQPTYSSNNELANHHGASHREQQEQPARNQFSFEQDPRSPNSSSTRPKPAATQNRGWQRWA